MKATAMLVVDAARTGRAGDDPKGTDGGPVSPPSPTALSLAIMPSTVHADSLYAFAATPTVARTHRVPSV